MNTQPITKQNLSNHLFHVNEIFYSLQGEGPWSGEPVIFIRLAGCNLQCTWCDTEYTSYLALTEFDIMAEIRKLNAISKKVVITGGEPFVHNLIPLVDLLHHKDFEIQIETNGMLIIPGFPYYKVLLVCSPKAGRIHKDIEFHCKHYKYVVNKEDQTSLHGFPSTPTQELGKRPPPTPSEVHPETTFWLMPQDDEDGKSLETAKFLCLKFGFRLSMRIHKLLNIR